MSTNRFHLLIYLSFCFLLCPYVSAFLSLTLSSSLSLSLSLFIYLSLSHSSSLFIYPPRSLCSLTLSHFYFHPLLSTSSTTHRYTTAFPPIWLAAAASLGFFHPDLPAITAAMATINSLYSYSVRKVLYFLPNVNFITAIFAFFLPFFLHHIYSFSHSLYLTLRLFFFLSFSLSLPRSISLSLSYSFCFPFSLTLSLSHTHSLLTLSLSFSISLSLSLLSLFFSPF